jgi:GNAT superfamily N-acetyltransferase
MYDCFEPLGAALGLPPFRADARRDWIEYALDQKLNLAAFLPSGEVAGHCFLVADEPGSAELAIFVRKESRRNGLGSALMKTALEWGALAGLRRMWALTSGDNRAAICLLEKFGFRPRNSASFDTELEIDLPAVPNESLPQRIPAVSVLLEYGRVR